MDFELTEEQSAIYEMATSFAAAELSPFAQEWDQEKTFPIATLQKAATLGLGGIYVREEFGGSGLSRLDGTLIIEALATGCPSIASYVSIHNMCAGMIDHYGTTDQRARWLPAMTSMEKLSSYCLTEPGAGSDASALTTRARREGDHYILNGQKQFISGAGASNVYIVMARTGENGPRGISAFIVPREAAGLSFGANEKKMGWSAQPTRAVVFDNVRIPAEDLLANEGEGFKIAMAGLDGGRLNIAAASLGGAQAAFDRTVAYMAQRRAFGQTLDGFQALQFRLADMATALEVSRTFLRKAARALDQGASPDTTRLCAMAKRVVTDSCFDVANQALQLHGGYGYLAEYGIEKIVRDLRVHQILEGTNEIMRVIIARSIVNRK
ncbi:acyl-CoA dehydrogenase family protein [Agrobacterium tumefaciens]|uniref:acyl-CoA dehydrogenase family protein n=1 Tax=Agrobacterium tumefaciens TaxID=358 RepID=UPI00287CA046|nr:acyl-CoA dehydrogenase family protein [Agrobacterium tumefaciens]MDS7594343.1 acyl-CoA dehydrogenase family protein [Agrobacterium tumefaciens]